MSLGISSLSVQCDPRVMRLSYRYGPIGQGSFGRVYMALVTNEGVLCPVALKKVHVTDHAKHPPLLHEAAALLRLRSHRSIPEPYGWGRSQFFEYLSLELLGPDLYSWFILMEKPLTSRNLNAIAWQMLDVLEYVHSQGVIHCDVKSSNILLGRGADKSHVFLSDFGISLPFDPKTRPSERTTLPRGSGYYMSLNNHLRQALSPHDDMESLAYTIIELRMGRLPWWNCTSHADVFLSKQKWTGEHWTATTDCPKVYGQLLDSVRDHAQALDYARWKRELCGESVPSSIGAEAPYKYDPSDHEGLICWEGYDSELDKPLTASGRELARVPESPEPWPPLSGSSHGFHQRSTWSGPVTLEEDVTFGPERELVLRELALIDRPPTCGTSMGKTNPPEVMKTLDSVLGKDNRGEVVAGGSGDGVNGNDSVYSGPGTTSEGSDKDEDEDKDLFRVPYIDDLDFTQFYDPEYDRV
uniref:non-specific serine/threonine protein kinase n=1 Tax=Ganoderma boninense TaxID=34458 RepID=A0A5K1JYN3_9APHY|nr:N/A [Ganoderma boninense]